MLECAEFCSTIRVDHTRMSYLVKNYFLTIPPKTRVYRGVIQSTRCVCHEFEPRRSDHFPPFFALSVAHPIFAPFGAHIWCEHLWATSVVWNGNQHILIQIHIYWLARHTRNVVWLTLLTWAEVIYTWAHPIIIFLIYCSRWVRGVSCRVAAHETDSSGDFDDVGLIGTLWVLEKNRMWVNCGVLNVWVTPHPRNV